MDKQQELSIPQRIQLKRSKGWRMPADAVKVDRSTKWGNQFAPGREYAAVEEETGQEIGRYICRDVAEAVECFCNYINSDAGFDLREQARTELRGKHLACWCKLGDPCHADVLLEIANAETQP